MIAGGRRGEREREREREKIISVNGMIEFET